MKFVIVNIDKRRPIPSIYGPYNTLESAQRARDMVPLEYRAPLVCITLNSASDLLTRIKRGSSV